jgi:hypothetical protein
VTAEIHAIITFDDDHKLQTRSTVEEIHSALEAVATPHIPLLRVQDPSGEVVWVNAAQIRTIRRQGPGETAGGF